MESIKRYKLWVLTSRPSVQTNLTRACIWKSERACACKSSQTWVRLQVTDCLIGSSLRFLQSLWADHKKPGVPFWSHELSNDRPLKHESSAQTRACVCERESESTIFHLDWSASLTSCFLSAGRCKGASVLDVGHPSVFPQGFYLFKPKR